MSAVSSSSQQQTSVCGYCQKSGESLPRCQRCQQIAYCDKACQRAAWATHKLVCSGKPKESPSSNGLQPIFPPKETGEISVYFENPTTKKLEQLTQERFKSMTGVLYSPMAVLTEQTHQHICESRARSVQSRFLSPQAVQNNKLVQQFRTKPPRLVLVSHPGSRLGLKSQEQIPAGAMVCYYGGEILLNLPDTYRNSQCSVPLHNQMHYAGLGSLINDGPPNCTLSELSGTQGQQIVITQRKIQENEELFINYAGGHIVKAGNYTISPETYATLVSFCERFNKKIKINEKDFLLAEYLFDTPHLFVHLLLENTLTLGTIRRLITQVQQRKRGPVCYISSFSNYLLFQKRSENSLSDFFELYQNFLESVDKIRSYGLDIQKKINALFNVMTVNEMTVNAYLFIVYAIHGDPNPLTEQSINNYRQLGILVDQIYLFANGTLEGTYLKRDDPFPPVSLNTDQFLEQYKLLSSYQKNQLKIAVEQTIKNIFYQPDVHNRVQTLSTLKQSME